MLHVLTPRPHHVAFAAASLPAAVWGSLHLTVQILLGLMLLDIITGLHVAVLNRRLDSRTGFDGMVRKSLILCLIGAFEIGGRVFGDAPVAPAVAAFFSMVEIVSITENCATAGLPIPPIVRDTLKRFQDTGQAPAPTSAPVPPATPEV